MSEGDGPYSHESGAKGEIESSLTTMYPYARFSATDRLDLWGTVGMGSGSMTIRYGDREYNHETDIGMRMGAVGARGQVQSASEGQGIDLAVLTDALWVRMESDAVSADAANGGNLAGAEADVSRLRLVLEGALPIELSGARTLTPSASIGVRHDTGDAETGTGLEVGGGLSYVGEGITVEGRVRGLVAHEDSGYEEWGASGSIRIDPRTSGRGLSFSLTPAWGQTGSTTEQLWGRDHTGGLARDDDFEAQSRIQAELGYGLRGPYRTGVLTPYTGASWAQGSDPTLRAGARWQVAPNAVVGLEANRTQGSGTQGPSNALMLRAQGRW